MSKTDEEIKALESLYQECEANLTRSAEYGKVNFLIHVMLLNIQV